jgi:hypothetical protein
MCLHLFWSFGVSCPVVYGTFTKLGTRKRGKVQLEKIYGITCLWYLKRKPWNRAMFPRFGYIVEVPTFLLK